MDKIDKWMVIDIFIYFKKQNKTGTRKMYIKHDLNKLFAELDPSFQLQEKYFLNF